MDNILNLKFDKRIIYSLILELKTHIFYVVCLQYRQNTQVERKKDKVYVLIIY